MAKKRKGGMVNLSDDPNGKREPGTFHKLDKAANATKMGSKTTSNGFKAGGATARKDGGAIGGGASTPSLAKRARGGRTTSPYSAAHSPSGRSGSSTSGHEGE